MKVSEEGENVLKLHTMFSILENLVEGGMNSYQEAALAKRRMEKSKDEQYSDFTEEERKKDEGMEAGHR